MKFEITKSFRFEACHSLPHLPKSHQCRRNHGHSYEVIVGVKGEMPEGEHWLQDYADISAAVSPLINTLDHQDLNELFDFPTTSENIAAWFWEELCIPLSMLSRVEIRETPTSNCILTE